MPEVSRGGWETAAAAVRIVVRGYLGRCEAAYYYAQASRIVAQPTKRQESALEPRLNVITLAVDDLERAVAFYRDVLGFASDGVIGTEWTDERTGARGAVALFELDGGLILSLYPRRDLAKDAEIECGSPRSGEFSLGQLVRTREEVDELLRKARSAGAAVTEACERPWGIYSGYFRDPDGHLWEVIWNPGRIPPASTTSGHLP